MIAYVTVFVNRSTKHSLLSTQNAMFNRENVMSKRAGLILTSLFLFFELLLQLIVVLHIFKYYILYYSLDEKFICGKKV